MMLAADTTSGSAIRFNMAPSEVPADPTGPTAHRPITSSTREAPILAIIAAEIDKPISTATTINTNLASQRLAPVTALAANCPRPVRMFRYAWASKKNGRSQAKSAR